jgi:hypothetical protein
MAAKKKKIAKKPVKKAVAKKKVAPPAKKKRKGTPRKPPMHVKVNHPELEDEEHEETFEIFKAYDRDGSGSIDRGEFSRLLEALGQAPSEDELAVALDVVDANHSGKISWDEFKAWWSSR